MPLSPLGVAMDGLTSPVSALLLSVGGLVSLPLTQAPAVSPRYASGGSYTRPRRQARAHCEELAPSQLDAVSFRAKAVATSAASRVVSPRDDAEARAASAAPGQCGHADASAVAKVTAPLVADVAEGQLAERRHDAARVAGVEVAPAMVASAVVVEVAPSKEWRTRQRRDGWRSRMGRKRKEWR